jgi:hypothetical protein
MLARGRAEVFSSSKERRSNETLFPGEFLKVELTLSFEYTGS